MPTKPLNLQDNFLNQIRRENAGVTIHLVNGFQIRGNVKGFDNFTVIVENMGKPQLIYKHAISTITPSRPINFMNKNESESAAVPTELTEPIEPATSE